MRNPNQRTVVKNAGIAGPSRSRYLYAGALSDSLTLAVPPTRRYAKYRLLRVCYLDVVPCLKQLDSSHLYLEVKLGHILRLRGSPAMVARINDIPGYCH